MNPAAEKLLAVKKEEKLGRELTADLRDEQLVSLVKGSSDGEPGDEHEIELNSNVEQTKRVLRASNAVIQDESGKTVGMVAVLSDVTKQRDLDRMKSEFVSKVTHELRTPIIAIKHSLAVVQDGSAGELTDAQKNFIGIANRNLERLGNLINDLLDLAKLEAKKMELHRSTGAVGVVIGSACETFGAWANSKSLKIKQQMEPDLPTVSFDPDRITQVLHNLVGNAMKFTPPGGTITLGARLNPKEQAVEVSVKDTGAGIAKEDISKLFQKFQQVGQKSLGEISGTGLGLAIAKEIMELHNGRIWVESEPGQGTAFLFTLPLGASESAKGQGKKDG
jgi:two-component system sensor histidine kinase VicK